MTRDPSKEEVKAAADPVQARTRGESTTEAEEFVQEALSEGELNKEIAKLAALPVGIYETVRVKNAKRLGMRVTALEAMVKAARPKPTKAPTDFLPHWNVAEWDEPVDGAGLLEELRKRIARYVVLPNEYAEVAVALWVLHTWVFDCFDITPYLAITSPTRRCGKTLLMTMLYWLCWQAKKNDSMSKASIYRSVEAEQPTLVLDEVGWVVDQKDERQGILCGGFERLGHVEICEGEGADITTKRYKTYCPKAFGLIGKLTATLMDRSIQIAMRRKLKEPVERLRRRDNDDHARLRRKCLRWANDKKEALTKATPKLPEGLNDRATDIWEPLFAIAECVGGEWPKLAVEAAIKLSGGEPVSEERGVELLRDIKAVFDSRDREAITSKRLISELCVDEERPWATYDKGKPITPKQLGSLLRPFVITSENVQTSETGEPQSKGYRQSRFAEAFARYVTVNSGEKPSVGQDDTSQPSSRPDADGMGITRDFSIRPGSILDGCEKCEKPANDGDSDAWTDEKSKPDHARQSGSSNGGSRPFRSDVEDACAELAERVADSTSGCVCAHCGKPTDGNWLHDRCLTAWTRRQAKLQAGGISETRDDG
jgi:putative DNA primase/helicase